MTGVQTCAFRSSSDSVTGQYTKGLHGSVIVPVAEDVKRGMTLCQAYANEGKCSGCRACYDKKVKVIAYPAHGRSMAKVIRIIKAA